MADRSVVIRLRGEIGDFKSKMRQAGLTAKNELGAELDGLSRKSRATFDELGGTAGKIGLAAVAGLGLAAKAAIDWESAWAGVTKTVDGSAAQYAELEQELRELARTLPATHAEIAGVAEAAGQLGVAREDIAAFTKTMVDLGETTNLTAEDAATSIAQMANVMRTAPDEIDNLGSTLVALGNAGASTERQIIEMAQRIAGAGAQIGLAESDILAIANAAASMGVEVEAGGTAVSTIFTKMAKAVAQGGPMLEKFASVAQMSSETFTAAFKDDPAQAFAVFTQGLDAINKSGGDVFTTLEGLKLSDVRVSQALLGMAASGDLLAESLDTGARAWEENSALAIEAGKRYATTQSQMRIAVNKIRDDAIDVGEAIAPAISGAANSVGDLADAFGSLPGPVKAATGEILGITAVTGGGLFFGAKVIGGISDTREALSSLSGTAPRTARALGLVSKAAAGLAILTTLDAIIDGLNESMRDALPGTEVLAGKLIDLKNGQVGELGKEFRDLAHGIEIVDAAANADGITRFFTDTVPNVTGLLPGENDIEELNRFRAAIEALDSSFAAIATSGSAEQALAAFDALADSEGLSTSERERLVDLMPQYTEALAASANQAKLAGDESAGAAVGIGVMGDAASEAAEEVVSLADAFDALSENFLDQREAGRNVRDSLRSIREAIRDYRKEHEGLSGAFKEGTKSGDEFAGLLDDLALDYQAQITAVSNLTGSQQKTLKVYNESFDSLVRVAQQLGMTKVEAEKYAKALLGTPRFIKSTFAVDTSRAEREIQSFINRHTGDRIVLGLDPKYAVARADGGPISGPGTGTSDSIPAMLSDGEHVLTAAEVSAAGGHGAILAWRKAIRGYASGGPVFASRPAPSMGGGSFSGGSGGSGGGTPLIGSATFQPHDYGDFMREMRQKQQLAAVGGEGF